MGFPEIFVLAVGLSMDAFAVSICKGLSVRKMKLRHALIAGAYFGGFQALMPLIGYYIGSQFADLITKFSHWVAFILLLIIGANMIRESFSKEEDECSDSFSPRAMLPMAVATSIDALAVGVALSLSLGEGESIFPPVIIIGITTFLFSAVGVKIGNVFGDKYKSKAELVGGIILILLGVKLLLDGLQVLFGLFTLCLFLADILRCLIQDLINGLVFQAQVLQKFSLHIYLLSPRFFRVGRVH